MAKKQFKAESKRLMDLMINSIYTNKEIFLREIISNASDALDKLRYTALTDETARSVSDDLHIKVDIDKENRTVTVTDNGIGMTAEDLESNLGTIARSGSLKFKEQIAEGDDTANIIGQFGVGFYSAFMVSDNVKVISKHYTSNTAYIWESEGIDGYSVMEFGDSAVGTKIIMHIKEDTEAENYSEFLDLYRLRYLIKRYSDYISYPIIMDMEKSRQVGEGEEKTTETYIEAETVNSMVPIWKRSKNEVTEDDLNAFYQDKFFDFKKPFATIKVSTEGIVSYDALLYLPSAAPFNYYTKDYEKGLELYSNGVLIMDKCADLLPDYLMFVKGVVDSQDLSLNISREMLQHDRQLKSIATNIEKKILAELKKKLENNREEYEGFFKEFGLQLKYGTVADYGTNKEKTQNLLLFYSSNLKKYVTLNEYVTAMPEAQKYIYYACGESAAKIDALPQAELVKEKGYDILCFTDEVDEFVVNTLLKFNEKEFRSVDADNDELLSDDEKNESKKAFEDNEELLKFAAEYLKDKVSKVVISKKLKTHPVVLSAEGQISIEMEKYFAAMPGENKPKAAKVLEINAKHQVFEVLQNAYKTDSKKAEEILEILYNSAMLIAGFSIDDPTAYSELICSLIK
ncbi:MAG: molecular chaperone HtpG [Clostridia bacterium]|nr:molecular chaperone HtpG [Clostridia bacterium]